MGVYEWVLMAVTFAVIIAAFFIVFALEKRKYEKLKKAISQEILSVKMKPSTRIALIILVVVLLIGGPVTTVCGSLLIEPIPHAAYAAIMGMMAFGGLVCLYGILGTVYNAVYATEEGIWVSRIFLKSKFYGYDEIVSVLDTTTTFHGRGGFALFKEGRKQIFFVSQWRDRNAKELIALIKERSPRLGKLKEGELFRM